MSKSTPAARVLAAVAAFIVAIVVLSTASPAAAIGAGAGLVIGQPFSADSGDRCPAGTTSGNLGWHVRPGPLPISVVDVVGVVEDHPLPADPRLSCSDPRFTTATFTAYHGDTAVDSESVSVDNGQLVVEFPLGDLSTDRMIPIDQIIVQVCRHAPPDMKIFDYCGKPVGYRPPPSPLVQPITRHLALPHGTVEAV